MEKIMTKMLSVIILVAFPMSTMAQSIENEAINLDASADLAYYQGKKGKYNKYLDGVQPQSYVTECEITSRFHPSGDAPYLNETSVKFNDGYFTFASINALIGEGVSTRQVNDQNQIVYTNTFDKLSGVIDFVGCGNTGHMSWPARNRVNYLVLDKNSVSIITTFSCGLIPKKHVASWVCKY